MPNGRNLGLPNPPRFQVDEVEGVVIDEVTGLEWTRDYSELSTHSDALQYCASLDVAEDGEPYRLPTRIELVSLVDRSSTPVIDGAVFPDTPLEYFWSSSAVHRDPAARFSVYFGVGETAWGPRDQAAAHARCVRSGIRRAGPRWIVEGALARDAGTGLLWERQPPTPGVTLAAARDYCDALRLDGVGFRLPTPKELQTLLEPVGDGETAAPDAGLAALLDSTAFPDARPSSYWGWDGELVPPMAVDSSSGFTYVTDISARNHVRCVGTSR